MFSQYLENMYHKTSSNKQSSCYFLHSSFLLFLVNGEFFFGLFRPQTMIYHVFFLLHVFHPWANLASIFKYVQSPTHFLLFQQTLVHVRISPTALSQQFLFTHQFTSQQEGGMILFNQNSSFPCWKPANTHDKL